LLYDAPFSHNTSRTDRRQTQASSISATVLIKVWSAKNYKIRNGNDLAAVW